MQVIKCSAIRAFLGLLGVLCLFVSIPQVSTGKIVKDTIPVKPVKLPEGYTAQLNTVYNTVGDWQGRMDLYIPPKNTSNPLSPVIINIHGGAWAHGNKESQSGFGSFLKRGFLVVNLEYRMAPDAPAPAAIQDVRSALYYLVQHQKQLSIDLNRIVLMGSSAGGHLALMGGLSNKSSQELFDPKGAKMENLKIAAIIDKYGPTDLSAPGSLDHIKKSAYSWLGAHAEDESFLKSISPLYYVEKTSPPVFIVHGNADPTVPYEQSVLLDKKLKQSDVFHQFVTVEGGLHGKFSPDEQSRISKQIIAFLIACKVIDK